MNYFRIQTNGYEIARFADTSERTAIEFVCWAQAEIIFIGKLSKRKLRIFLGKYLLYKLIWAERYQFERVLFFGKCLPFKLIWAELCQLKQILKNLVLINQC